MPLLFCVEQFGARADGCARDLGSDQVRTLRSVPPNLLSEFTIAAGNEGTFDSSADNPYVLTVGGSDSNDSLYSWSNTGNNIDLAAPGSAYTTVRGGGYSSASGTSFAAPQVAGAIARVCGRTGDPPSVALDWLLAQGVWVPDYGRALRILPVS